VTARLGIPVVGTARIAVEGKLAGAIPTARRILDALRQAGLRLSEPLYREALFAGSEPLERLNSE
jgi:predicted nucleic acid-binding protein